MRLCVLFGVVFFSFLRCFGAEEVEAYTVKKIECMFPKNEKTFRINSLWPSDYVVIPSIEPAVPNDFVMREIACGAYSGGAFFWGPQDAIDAIDEQNLGPSLRATPKSVLVFHASADIALIDSKSFSGTEGLEDSFKAMGARDFFRKTYLWGRYPVLNIGGTFEGRYLFSAWIGLNYESNVVFARLAYPVVPGRPNADDIALWEKFLSETKGLPEPDCFIAQGIDMEPGYTVFDPHGEKVLCVAERRRGDNTVQFVVFPEAKETTCSFVKFEHGLAGTEWRRGDEILKVYIDISKKDPDGTSIEYRDFPVTVFLKSVDQFTLDQKRLRQMVGVCVQQTVLQKP